MNKIFKFITILFLTVVSAIPVNAKMNLFPEARYIPALDFYDESGKKYQLYDFNADLLIAVLWSRHCGPCIKDMQPLAKFAKRVENKGIKVILISPAEEWKNVAERQRFWEKIGADKLPQYFDQKSDFMKRMGIFATPTAILVTKNHLEAGQITGSVKWDKPEVEEYLLKLKDKLLQKLNQSKTANQQN